MACLQKDYSLPLRDGEWRFRSRWALFPLLLVPALICAGLGVWQLDRAGQKRALAADLAARVALPPLEIGEAPVDADAVRYRAVTARGRLEASGQIYIEGRRHAGKTGYYVVTPLRIAGSERRLLINRGWVETMDASVPDGEVVVTGVADVPAPPALALHGGADAAKAWGTRWPYLTLPLYAATVGHPLQTIVVLQDRTDPHGFVREWPRELPKEGMHLGYALQWFAFSLIALAVFLRLSVTRGQARGERSA
ncbi:MAG: SURF1 family protein [Gammaproteobacteria bacterium]|jgi:surfeit locus 1 family protein|nr:SURF1 family protein [Gammaproteobacteria bacterium]